MTHRFCAWDGEGAEIDGKHEYILLQNSRGEYYRNTLLGLSTQECFDFIMSHAVDGDINVMFGLSYDANMMFRDIPKETLRRLWQGHSIYYGPYVLHYTHRKELILKLLDYDKPLPKLFKQAPVSLVEKHHSAPTTYAAKKTVHIWEVVGFFQSTYLKAIEKYLPGQKGMALIEEWKLRRPTFQVSEFEEIRAYCLLECELLVKLMDKLDQYLDVAEVKLSRWNGAGAIAGAMMKKYEVNKHHGEHTSEMWRLAQQAYGGGRIEMPRYGFTRQTCTVLDINSAYPSAMPLLPSLAVGRWKQVQDFEPGTFGMWSIEWEIEREELIYPFFYRCTKQCLFDSLSNGADKRIIYPRRGRGVYWTPEVEAALRIHNDTQVRVQHGWVWVPDTDDKPFSWVEELYTLRRQWKALDIGAEYVLKLGMNSLYGKMAQQVGGRDNKAPACHQLMWAGYVTSYTRAALYAVAKANESRLIYLATDGMGLEGSIDKQVLPDLGGKLGQWSCKKVDAICAVQAGIYFTFENGVAQEPKEKIRGFDRGKLHYTDIVLGWTQRKRYIEVPSTRFITLGSALASDIRWKLWRSWHTIQRKLQIDPAGTKRQPLYWRQGITQGHFYGDAEPWNSLVDTLAAQNMTPEIPSKAYPLQWLGERAEELLLDGIHIDEFNEEVEDVWR